MGYGTELKPNYRMGLEIRDWAEDYLSTSSEWGFSLVKPESEGLDYLPTVRAIAKEDVSKLEQLRQSDQSARMNIVLVSDNEFPGKLPLRWWNYAAQALTTIQNLQRTGIVTDSLRILSPCHLNPAINGGDIQNQIQNTQATAEVLASWVQEEWRDLRELNVITDIGLPMTKEELLAEGKNALSQISQADLANLRNRSPNCQDELLAAYLLAHPPAWNLGKGIAFAPPTDEIWSINFMPQSELPFLKAMQSLLKNQEKVPRTITLISRVKYAPYHHYGCSEELVSVRKSPGLPFQPLIIKARQSMKPRSGHPMKRQLMKELGMLLKTIQDLQRQL